MFKLTQGIAFVKRLHYLLDESFIIDAMKIVHLRINRLHLVLHNLAQISLKS